MSEHTSSRALDEHEAARYCGISESFLRASRLSNPRTAGPAYIRLGLRAVRYLPEDLDAWMTSQRVVVRVGRDREKGVPQAAA